MRTTQYTPIKDLFAVPHQWEKWVPLGEVVSKRKRRLTEALAKWDQRSHRKGRKRAA